MSKKLLTLKVTQPTDDPTKLDIDCDYHNVLGNADVVKILSTFINKILKEEDSGYHIELVEDEKP